MNRISALQRCVSQIKRLTDDPYVLMIADDGSTDGTVEWARSQGIPVVTGERRGCAWNKNRALYFLNQCTDCDTILLIEDDAWPVRSGWDRVWAEAGRRWQHVNFDGSSYNDGLDPDDRPKEPGTAKQPYITPHVTGVCTVTSRAALDEVGYLDTRFRGYGIEHVEWTRRYAARYAEQWAVPADRYPGLNYGVLMAHVGESAFNLAEVNANHRVYTEMLQKPDRGGFRPPWQNDEEWLTLGLEVALASQLIGGRSASTLNQDADIDITAAEGDPGAVDEPHPVLSSIRQNLPGIAEFLKFPNGPQLWFFTDGTSPERALLSLASIVLNGYSPGGITIFGSHHWNERARKAFDLLAPFVTVAPSDLVFATISKVGGEELADWARHHIEVERALAPLIYPIDACCVATDDVFVFDGVDDALRSARLNDLVFVAGDGQIDDDQLTWPWVAPGKPSATTREFGGGLHWIRRFADPQVVGRLASRQSPDPQDPSTWANSLIATLYASRQTEALPVARYVHLSATLRGGERQPRTPLTDGGDAGPAALVAGPVARHFDDAQLKAICDAVLGDASPSQAVEPRATTTRQFDFERHSAMRASETIESPKKRNKDPRGGRRSA